MKCNVIIKNQVLADLYSGVDLFAPSTPKKNPSVLELLDEIQHQELNELFKDSALVQEIQELTFKLRSLALLMNNNVKEGIKWYRIFEREIKADFEEFGYLYTKQYSISLEALYYYKIRKYRQAFSLTLECISLNEILIKAGITSLIFRSIEQNKNIGKILLKKGDCKKAFEQKQGLLKYFLHGNGDSLYGYAFKEKKLWDKYTDIRKGFANSYFVELVYELSTIKLNSKSYFLAIFSGLKINQVNEWKIISDWIKLKQFWYNGDFNGFLSGFNNYMRNRIDSSLDFVKIPLIADAKALLTRLDNESCREIIKRLDQYLEDNIIGMEYFKNPEREEIIKVFDDFDISLECQDTC